MSERHKQKVNDGEIPKQTREQICMHIQMESDETEKCVQGLEEWNIKFVPELFLSSVVVVVFNED